MKVTQTQMSEGVTWIDVQANELHGYECLWQDGAFGFGFIYAFVISSPSS